MRLCTYATAQLVPWKTRSDWMLIDFKESEKLTFAIVILNRKEIFSFQG